jgi:hypothetical protein
MNGSKYASVTITFDGMMLFRFDDRDKKNRRCEVMFRKARDHKIEVIVKKKRGKRGSDELCRLTHDEVKRYKYLWLYVENHGVERDYRNTGTAKRGGWYDRILQLDGNEFYGAPLRLKSEKYKPTMYVCDGCVGADSNNDYCKDKYKADNGKGKDNGNDKRKDERWGLSRVDTCYRVEDDKRTPKPDKPGYSFEELKYAMSRRDWRRLIKSYEGDVIEGLNPFLRWVNTTINLNPGQTLMLIGERANGTTRPFKPLITNYQESDAYWIHVKYTDSDPPDSLEDCKGLGHHCEAFDFEYSGQSISTIYSVFSPKNGNVREPTAPWELIITSSDVPCCLSACVKQ